MWLRDVDRKNQQIVHKIRDIHRRSGAYAHCLNPSTLEHAKRAQANHVKAVNAVRWLERENIRRENHAMLQRLLVVPPAIPRESVIPWQFQEGRDRPGFMSQEPPEHPQPWLHQYEMAPQQEEWWGAVEAQQRAVSRTSRRHTPAITSSAVMRGGTSANRVRGSMSDDSYTSRTNSHDHLQLPPIQRQDLLLHANK